MKIAEIINLLEEVAPLHYAEDFDNVGLLVGDKKTEVTNILVTLDTLEIVVDEAIEKGCNLIISFHPIIFKGLKKINGNNYVERVVIKAIQHNIAIYSMHTALDNHWQGVNYMIANKLELQQQEILLPKSKTICKLTTYVPVDSLEKVRQALFKAGAGELGNYQSCSFYNEGTGSFKPTANANPTIGVQGVFNESNEIQLQLTFLAHLKGKIVSALQKTHPYEEVAYELSTLENYNQRIGMGMIGNLKNPISETEALSLLKINFKAKGIRHSEFLNKPIQRIAVLGGSGAFAINKAKQAGADMFVTADVKYHEFYQAEQNILIADIGHYESEQYTKNIIITYLTEKISNFASAYNLSNILLSEINTNPIKYF